jgi:hypothetical protein
MAPNEDALMADVATAVVTPPPADLVPDDQLPVDAEDGEDPTVTPVASDPLPAEAI